MAKYVDLSREIYTGMPTFTEDSKPAVISNNDIESVGYNITLMVLSSHLGTHFDAPWHFIPTGLTVDQVPPEQFIGEAFKVDLRHKKPKELITVEDLLPHQDRVVKGAKIILHTGWDKVYPQKSYFSDMPRMSLELARWLADREIGLLGLDIPTPTPEYPMVRDIHVALLQGGMVIVEALCNLEQVDAEFFLIAPPLALRGRDGSPVRAIGACGLTVN